MLRIHQPYIKKKKVKYFLALASMGALLLGSVVMGGAFSESSTVQAAEIKYMQQFTNPICQSMSTGDTMDLIDPRGEDKEKFETYHIVKLKDGKCWMQDNLALPGGTAITSTDSDVKSNWTLPASANTFWDTSDSQAVQMKNGVGITVNSGSTGDGKGWQSNYGNYYSWCAATAESCKTNRDGNGIAAGENATESICPKNWHLPTGGGSNANGTGEFGVLNGLNITSVQANPYKFPAAGNVSTNAQLYSPGTRGFYWSRTSGSTSQAYGLGFLPDSFGPGTNFTSRFTGHPVRCVADPTVMSSDFTYEGDIFWEESKDGNVTVNVPSTLTIDAASGMEEVADAAKVIEGTATATISSNTAYSVTLHANQPELKDAENASNSAEISVVSDTNPVEPGYNAWGFWDGSGDGSTKLYNIPITSTAKEIYNTTSSSVTDKGNATIHTYYVGISISPSLPSGTYGTEVTITAATK